jgi:hypothetical protein
MSEYNDYVTSVNKIFDYLNKMRAGWDSQDNISHIENIEEYKRVVVANVETFKHPAPMPKNDEPVEETAPEPEETETVEESTDDTTISEEDVAPVPESSAEM